MDDQGANQAGGRSVNQHAKPASRIRVLADILFWIYIAGAVIAVYAGGIESWPRWAWIVAAVIGGALFLWPLFFVVRDLSHLTEGRPLRFSLRAMLLVVSGICVLIWLFTQLDWIEKRERWRRHNRGAVRSTEGQSPLGLVRLFEPGVSLIEIQNGTQAEIEYARRLFPEATVVAADMAPDGNPAVPAVAPVETQPAGGKSLSPMQ